MEADDFDIAAWSSGAPSAPASVEPQPRQWAGGMMPLHLPEQPAASAVQYPRYPGSSSSSNPNHLPHPGTPSSSSGAFDPQFVPTARNNYYDPAASCSTSLQYNSQGFPHHQQQQLWSPPTPAYYPPPPYYAVQPNQQQQRHAIRQPAEGQSAQSQAPSGSGSMPDGPSASSAAPMKRQHHPLRPGSRQQQRYTPLQKVQQWNQFGAGPVQDSGVQSMSHSTANSVLSSVHPMSCMSAVSSLPDEYGSTVGDHPYFQHIPRGLRHEQDPDKIRGVLPDLIPLINDESEEVVLRALNIINGIAKTDKARSPAEAPLIGEQRVVEELLRTLRTHRKSKRTLSYALRTLHFISDTEPGGRDLFVRVLDTHGAQALAELVNSIGVPDHSCFKYAFLVLHNLLSEPRCASRVHAFLCEQRTLTQILGWLGDGEGDNAKNEKFLNIVTDIVQKLITKSSEQMAFFIGLNGYQKLINMIAHCQQEALLWRVTKLLDKIAQTDPERLVSTGLLEALQRHLDHPSQRLVRQALACIRSVSHVRACGERPIHPLLHRLLQLLGTSDLRLKEACIDALANLCANNARNKAFLVQACEAVPALFQLLFELDSVRAAGAADDAFQRQLEGIQETALTLIKSLSSGAQNPAAALARQQILGTDEHKRMLLGKLREWHFGLLRRTLQLLHQLAISPSDPSLLAQLRFSVSLGGPRLPQFPDAPLVPADPEFCSFASQCVLLLHQFINLLPDTTELCRNCLDTLKAMCRDAALLEEIYAELRSRRIRLDGGQGPRVLVPQALACFCEPLAPNAIQLLAELARVPGAAQTISRHGPTIEVVRSWAGKELQQNQPQQQQQAVRAARQAAQLLGIETVPAGMRNSGGGEQLCPVGRRATSSPQPQTTGMKYSSPPITTMTEGPFENQKQNGIEQSGIIGQGLDDNNMSNLQEELAPFGNIEEMQDLTIGCATNGDEFSDDFGLLINALCPNSSPTAATPLP